MMGNPNIWAWAGQMLKGLRAAVESKDGSQHYKAA